MTGELRTALRRLIGPAYVPVICLAFSWSALAPAFPQYLSGLGAGVATVGTIIAMKGIGQVASDVPGGIMLGAWGLRRITLLSYVFAIGANALLAFTTRLAVITVLTFASGFSTSILITAVMTTVRTTVPARLRGRALSGAGGSLRVGMLLGPIVGGLVAERFGVAPVFLLRVAALSVGMLSFAASTTPAATTGRSGSPGARAVAEPFRRVAAGLRGRWYAVATVGLVILILSILRTSREVILPLWGEGIGLSPAAIGLAMSSGAAFDLLLFVPAGIISDRFGRKAAASICLVVFSIGLLALLPTGGLVGFVVAAAIVGIGNGFGAGINMTTGTDLAPRSAVSEFLGMWRLYGDLGSAAGPVLVGALAAAVALGPAVAATASIGILGAAVMLVAAPETRTLGEEDELRATARNAAAPPPP